MHEAGLAVRVMQCVTDGLAGVPHGPVRAVRLRLGVLAAVNADALEFAFTCLSQGTPLARTRLVFERVPLTIGCDACGATSEVADLVFRCARCGSERTRVLTGRELEVSSVDVDDAEAAHA